MVLLLIVSSKVIKSSSNHITKSLVQIAIKDENKTNIRRTSKRIGSSEEN